MSAVSTTLPRAGIERSTSHTLNIYFKEAKYEFLKLLRLPIYSLSTILFPVMFYILFGLLLNRGHEQGGVSVAAYLVATYGTFGVMGASLFGFGAGLAGERGLGWLQVKRASPMPPFAYFAAKVIVCMAFSLIIVTLLLMLGVLFGGVHMAIGQAVRLMATLILGTITFCSMGMAIGYFAGPTSAPAIVNILYLPLSFASGLWIPIDMLPHFMQRLAPFLPPYHLGQLALGVVGVGTTGSAAGHWEALAGFALICLGIARIGFQRDEGKSFG
jgi:ABC-2 type transport system permease protein